MTQMISNILFFLQSEKKIIILTSEHNNEVDIITVNIIEVVINKQINK